jgi:hypothetical protein
MAAIGTRREQETHRNANKPGRVRFRSAPPRSVPDFYRVRERGTLTSIAGPGSKGTQLERKMERNGVDGGLSLDDGGAVGQWRWCRNAIGSTEGLQS